LVGDIVVADAGRSMTSACAEPVKVPLGSRMPRSGAAYLWE
jgi:hypothetical protein